MSGWTPYDPRRRHVVAEKAHGPRPSNFLDYLWLVLPASFAGLACAGPAGLVGFVLGWDIGWVAALIFASTSVLAWVVMAKLLKAKLDREYVIERNEEFVSSHNGLIRDLKARLKDLPQGSDPEPLLKSLAAAQRAAKEYTEKHLQQHGSTFAVTEAVDDIEKWFVNNRREGN